MLRGIRWPPLDCEGVMVEEVFGALFGVSLAGLVLAVVAGIALLAFPRKKAARRVVTASRVPAHT